LCDSVDWERTADYRAIVGGMAAIVTVAFGTAKWNTNRRQKRVSAELGRFIEEGQQLLPGKFGSPLKFEERATAAVGMG